MKYGLLLLVAINIVSLQASNTENDKLVAAIAASDFRKSTSLYRKFLPSRTTAQARKELGILLTRTAADVIQDRKESISLTIDRRDIMAERRSEKLADQMLIAGGVLGILSGLYALNCAYAEYRHPIRVPINEQYARLAAQAGYGLFGLGFGSYLAYNGYSCTTQHKALVSAERIKEYFDKEVILK